MKQVLTGHVLSAISISQTLQPKPSIASSDTCQRFLTGDGTEMLEDTGTSCKLSPNQHSKPCLIIHLSSYGGKLQRIERMIHHYGSGLNALPLLSQFRQTPNDTYLLRVGYGGITGPLSNIRQDGSMYNAFHSFPDTLRGDDYSGDYGPNFLGMMIGSGVYVVHDPDVGPVTYGGNMGVSGNSVTVQPRDALRRRVYVAQLGVYVTTSAGQIEQFSFDTSNLASLKMLIVPGPAKASSTVVWIETPGTTDTYIVSGKVEKQRGGWAVELGSVGADVIISKA